MALVTRAELQSTLNIGTLYPNEVLDQVIGAAEDVILSMLVRYKAQVVQVCCQESVVPPAVGTVIRFRTNGPHRFLVGQRIRFGAFPLANYSNREFDIIELVEDDVIRAESVTVFNPGLSEPTPVIPPAEVYAESSRTFYDAVPEVREATLAIAVDIFQSRVAPGGQMQGIDFTPGPYRLGRSLVTRVSGLIGRWIDAGVLVG
jgi:hypothetical protein